MQRDYRLAVDLPESVGWRHTWGGGRGVLECNEPLVVQQLSTLGEGGGVY